VNIIRFLIYRPVSVIMAYVAVLMLGITAYYNLPVSLMPAVDIPEIMVHVNYPGSARELENAIVRNLRTQLMQVAHINDVTSETSDGQSIIRLSFDYGTSIDYASIEVNEKIDVSMSALPRDMDRPRVVKASAADLPVFYLNVTFNDSAFFTNHDIDNRFLSLSEFCENVIRKRVEQLPQVALADMSGLTAPQVLLKPDQQKMRSLNLSVEQLQQAIEQSNAAPGSIMVRDGHYQYFLRFSSYLKTPDDIGNIRLRIDDKVILMKDISEITVQPQKQRGLFITGNQQAVTMAIIQQAGTQMADMKETLHGLIRDFEKDYPELQFEITKDQTRLLDYSISNLRQNLVLGSILAFLVLFLFLKDLRSPFLIGIAVPVSLVISFLLFKLFNISINIISLSGLALGIGMIIDCSIIVIDNISQYHARGFLLHDACIKGTAEVIIPMLSSTLTTSAVFIPLIFASGMAGALFYDEAISISVGNAASFIVAITLLPVMYALLHRSPRMNPDHSATGKGIIRKRWKLNFLHKVNIGGRLEVLYERGIYWVFDHKVTVLVAFFVLLGLNGLLLVVVEKEKLPALTQTEAIVRIDWNQNIHLTENRKRIEGLINRVRHFTVQSSALIGEHQFIVGDKKSQDYYQAEIYLRLKEPGALRQVKDTLYALLRHFPQAKSEFLAPQNMFETLFNNNEPPLLAMAGLKGGRVDVDSILSFAEEADLRVGKKSSNPVSLKQHLSISIDQEKLLLYDVEYDVIYKAIKTMFNEYHATTLRSYQRYMPVLFGDGNTLVGQALREATIKNRNGDEFPLHVFINVYPERDLKYITAGQQGEYVALHYDIQPEDAARHMATLRTLTEERNFPHAYFGGTVINARKMIRELSFILIISLLLLYFILAIQFESFLQPLIVLLEIPADIAGALFMLWIFDDSLNIMSAIGIIVMCGIIINDSILKVDTINQLRKEGLPLMEAIKQGGILRLRSILMTAMTTIFAILPFFVGSDMGSELQRPLSLALIGGMTVGTLVSLFFIPLAYWMIYQRRTG
jgi:multidrug efflux pump subunit AcrB